jgi:DNA invertase Pin-like site-specific DNA recombinase
VSTSDQTCQNQLDELRQYAAARGWSITQEYLDEGVSGTKESRPALDALLKDAKRRKFDALLVWSLDRVGRSLRHLLTVIDEFQGLNVAFVALRDGLDLTTAAGRLQMAVLGALSQFERDRLRERTIAGLRRAKAEGKRLGRQPIAVSAESLQAVAGLPNHRAAEQLGVSLATYKRWKAQKPLTPAA